MDLQEGVEIRLTSQAEETHLRRFITSSRASSILDDQEDEEDEVQEREPELEIITSDDDATHSSFSSKSSTPRKGNAIVASSDDSRTEKMFNSLVVGLTEGMSNYLCVNSTGSLDNPDSFKHQTKGHSTMQSSDSRNGSDTEESVQKLFSSGDCGLTPLCRSKRSKHADIQSQSFPAAFRKDTTSSCSDLNFQDMRSRVASDVCQLLGSKSPTTADWMSTIGIWSASSRCCAPIATSTHKRVARNRCSHRTAQKGRMQRLWYQWHSQAQGEADETLRRAADLCPNHGSKTLHTNLWTSEITKSMDDSKLSAESTSENSLIDELYYDSDPEVFRHSRMTAAYPTFDDFPACIDTTASYGSAGVGPIPNAPRNAQGQGAPCFNGISYSTSEDMEKNRDFEQFDFRDDVAVEEFLKELTLGTVTLIWHPSNADDVQGGRTDQSSVTSKSPVSVQGWFEMGSRLQSTVVHPKFMWRKTYQPHLNHRKLGMSCRTPDSIDLLSVVRVLTPETLDREVYPFAKVNCSFSILTNSKARYVFEAATPEDRDWFVHGLKLVVARFASMIIVGDDQMFAEFFSPWAHSPLLDSELDDKGLSSDSFVENESGDGYESSRPLFVSTTEKDKNSLWGTKDFI